MMLDQRELRRNRDCPDTQAARRERNLEAMRSAPSIAVGACALLLVALVCTFYDHPAMKTPQMFSSLYHANAKPL
jgi:hypothetical protein